MLGRSPYFSLSFERRRSTGARLFTIAETRPGLIIELRSNIGRTHTILVQADDCRVSLLLFSWTLMHAARKVKEVRLLSPAICAEPNDPAQETSLAKRPLSLVPVPKC